MMKPTTLWLILALSFIIILPVSQSPAFAENRLSKAGSPYLRQHATDLVDWYPWGEEAFQLAREQNKPIFLSVGYSACHWCHVMQKESFNNMAIAKLIGDDYIAVLVDRERRPEIDEIHMMVTEAITGRGGWPNNVILTPDLKPIYGSPYLPPQEFGNLLTTIASEWRTNQKLLQDDANQMATAIAGYMNRKKKAQEIGREDITKAALNLAKQVDPFYGGIGQAPKFFYHSALMLMTEMAAKDNNKEIYKALETTLNTIAKSGTRDQLEGGFHRYAVDQAWRVPHFEKMLYDQALLSTIYLDFGQLSGNRYYTDVALDTLDYILADLTAKQGGYFTARDADSEGEEGTYYIWTKAQLDNILKPIEVDLVIKTFGEISEGELAGKIVLHYQQDDENKTSPQTNAQLNPILQKLKQERLKRERPFRDPKIITSWNALTILAMAKASDLTGKDKYRESALKTAEFIWQNMRDEKGYLLRSYFEGKASSKASLDDYVFYALALVSLYDLTGDEVWLKRSQTLGKQIDEKFLDTETGDYFFSPSTTRVAYAGGFARAKITNDADLPSANGAMVELLSKLNRRTLEPAYARSAESLIAALSGRVKDDTIGGAYSLKAIEAFARRPWSHRQYGARGRVVAKAQKDKGQKLIKFVMRVKEGWHINSKAPLEKDFIATKLEITHNGKALNKNQVTIIYPKEKRQKLGFHSQELSLYDGAFEIIAKGKTRLNGRVEAKLTLQACSDSICLAPEELPFILTAQ